MIPPQYAKRIPSQRVRAPGPPGVSTHGRDTHALQHTCDVACLGLSAVQNDGTWDAQRCGRRRCLLARIASSCTKFSGSGHSQLFQIPRKAESEAARLTEGVSLFSKLIVELVEGGLSPVLCGHSSGLCCSCCRKVTVSVMRWEQMQIHLQGSSRSPEALLTGQVTLQTELADMCSRLSSALTFCKGSHGCPH